MNNIIRKNIWKNINNNYIRNYSITGNQIRVGMAIEHDKKICEGVYIDF